MLHIFSLAFERDLEKDEHLYVDKNTLYKLELFDELQSEVAETRSDNERLRQVISNRDQELEESGRTINHLQTERESLKRQLEDLQNTLEYQEAKMDRSSGRSSAERRSLRRKKSSTTGKPPISPAVLESEKVNIFKNSQWARAKKKLVKSNKSIPFFAISKMAKNQFLNWEKVSNCQKCNFTGKK